MICLGGGVVCMFIANQLIVARSDLDPFCGAWTDLAALCPSCSQCQTVTYAAVAVERALRRGARVNLITAHDNGALVGLWVVKVAREGLFRVLRPVGCGSGEEYATPLISPAAGPEVASAMIAAALAIDCDIAWILNAREGSALAAALMEKRFSARRQRRGTIPGYEIELRQFSSWADYAAQAPAKLLHERRRRMRRLTERGAVELGWCRTADEAEAMLRWIFDTKARWARSRRIDTPWLRNAEVRDFFIQLAREIDLTEVPLIAFVKLDGEPIAASINLIGASALEYFITTYDVRYLRYSPGEQLVEFLVKWSIENRRDFDYRIMATDYKARNADRMVIYRTSEIYLSQSAQWLAFPLAQTSRFAQRLRRFLATLNLNPLRALPGKPHS